MKTARSKDRLNFSRVPGLATHFSRKISGPAEEDGLEIILNFLERDIHAGGAHHVMRELPIVVEAALVFLLLNLLLVGLAPVNCSTVWAMVSR